MPTRGDLDPASVLGQIVARKRADVAARRAVRPQASVQAEAAPTERNLAAALAQPLTGLLLECKKASPSRGLLRADFDPAAVARAYAPLADAISVVVDGPFFAGDLAWLAAVRAAVRQPVLCKDFVLEPYQVYEARALGADSVLLMLSVLDDEGLLDCLAACRELGMYALCEVHDEAELERAVSLGAHVIGINNRDLRTLEVDLATTERLAPLVPSDRVLVSESGIASHADLRRLRERVDAFLIGSSLVSAPDPGLAARRIAVGRVKVCGLTRPEDAAAAWACGATFGGLIFAEGSPRRVTLEQAERVRQAAPLLQGVGVFVNAPVEEVAAAARALRLSAVQLHGEEEPGYVAALRPDLPRGCAVWKAVRVRDRIPLLAETGADRLVLDAHREGQRGGTGQTFDWSLLRDHPGRGEVVLGGGLSAHNAAAADGLDVWALDVNSGVESSPGVKPAGHQRGFFAALRGESRLTGPPGR